MLTGHALVLIKSPSLWPHWYEQWDEQISAYAAEHGLDYINLLNASDEIGIDMQTGHLLTPDLHLNIYGAEKLSRYFAEILAERLRRARPAGAMRPISADWENKEQGILRAPCRAEGGA